MADDGSPIPGFHGSSLGGDQADAAEEGGHSGPPGTVGEPPADDCDLHASRDLRGGLEPRSPVRPGMAAGAPLHVARVCPVGSGAHGYFSATGLTGEPTAPVI